MPSSAASSSYREAYAALSRIVAELESGEADLDRVLPLIEEARAAYAVCRGRIEALRLVMGAQSVPELDADSERDPDTSEADLEEEDDPDAY
ncbi:exodeoxyribonuclease VII small subunit [Deinococcus sp.]|uniref:exodeoxyribonuclease VII small subunit n=1 Tax=Deinococcus sp. TaxID=47478 RepID=UPI003CC57F7E